MGGSTWVQNKTELFEGELVVFQRANSPNWYMRVYIANESKHFQKSLRTKSQYDAIEKAKVEYKILQQKVAKEEKVFTISLGEAIEGWFENEVKRERRGVIKNSTFKRRTAYIKNQFAPHFGLETKVNDISDKQMVDYIDIRLRRLGKKSTLRQEVAIIKGFYNTYLIKKGFVFKIPEIPEFTGRYEDRAKRDDTFNLKEYEKLFKFLREWVKGKNVSFTRTAVKEYGKKGNKEKVMNEWERKMEIHRRVLIRELVLISANTGLRLPSEILSLKWGDVRVKKEKFSGMFNADKEVEQLVAVIKVGSEMKTGARVVQGICGSYFKRLKDYFRNELGYEPKDSDYVFMEFFGRRKFNALDRYALYRMWGELMRDCGLNRIDFQLYHLRHFYITQSILNGVDLLLIAKNAGNSPNTIFQHYEHVEMEKQTQNLLKRRNTKEEMENEIEI